MIPLKMLLGPLPNELRHVFKLDMYALYSVVDCVIVLYLNEFDCTVLYHEKILI